MPKKQFPAKPHFSWMSWGMLRACRRRWFNYAFAYDLPGPLGYRFQAERKLTFWSAFPGQLADDGISHAIRHFKKHGAWIQELDEWLHERARLYIRETQAWIAAADAGADLPRIETQVLDRYFFDDVPNKGDHMDALHRAQEAVRRFYATDIPGRIEATPKEGIEIRDGDFPWETYDGVPVYTVYDFALRNEGKATIFDWKTGKLTPETEQNAVEQLHWYALYAMQAWGCKLEDVRLAPVFLMANGEYHETIPDPIRIKVIRDGWVERHRDIKALMGRHDSPESLMGEFPFTENLGECAKCQFRSCPGYARIRQE